MPLDELAAAYPRKLICRLKSDAWAGANPADLAAAWVHLRGDWPCRKRCDVYACRLCTAFARLDDRFKHRPRHHL